MNDNKKILDNFLALTIVMCVYLLSACDEPRGLLEPAYLTRVPRPTNLAAVVDKTPTGKYRVTLSWQFQDNGNLNSFEANRAVIRAMNDTSQYVPLQPTVRVSQYADSALPSITGDSLVLLYKIIPNGKDRFVGQASDTAQVVVKK
jgi:hypothetical protein